MELHRVQSSLLSFLEKQKGNLEDFSLRDIGEEVGVGKKPQVIAHHLNQLEDKGYIRRESSDSRVFTVLKKPISDVVYVNLYGFAECGPEGLLGEDAVIDKVPLSSKTFGISNPKDYFLVKARGKSMEPMITNGDLVLAKIQSNVENGSIAVVVHDEVPKIKKVIKGSDKKYALVSVNPEYSTEAVFNNDDNLRVVGSVKGIIRMQN